jgi:hypothetical protein
MRVDRNVLTGDPLLVLDPDTPKQTAVRIPRTGALQAIPLLLSSSHDDHDPVH